MCPAVSRPRATFKRTKQSEAQEFIQKRAIANFAAADADYGRLISDKVRRVLILILILILILVLGWRSGDEPAMIRLCGNVQASPWHRWRRVLHVQLIPSESRNESQRPFEG